jgi:hypothetical protein
MPKKYDEETRDTGFSGHKNMFKNSPEKQKTTDTRPAELQKFSYTQQSLRGKHFSGINVILKRHKLDCARKPAHPRLNRFNYHTQRNIVPRHQKLS